MLMLLLVLVQPCIECKVGWRLLDVGLLQDGIVQRMLLGVRPGQWMLLVVLGVWERERRVQGIQQVTACLKAMQIQGILQHNRSR
jgi:hypothetical protein